MTTINLDQPDAVIEGVTDDLTLKWHHVVKTLIAETSKDFTLMINIQEVPEPIIEEQNHVNYRADQIHIIRCTQNDFLSAMNQAKNTSQE